MAYEGWGEVAQAPFSVGKIVLSKKEVLSYWWISSLMGQFFLVFQGFCAEKEREVGKLVLTFLSNYATIFMYE